MPYFGVPIRNGISPGLGSVIGFGSRNPIQAVITALFGAGEQGIAVPDLSPSNGYLFQDSAGTTPVTAYEQKVGLILDRSKGAALGPELVTNGDFSNGTTGWTSSNTMNVVSGELQVTTSSFFGRAYQQLSTTPGVHKLTGTLRNVSGNSTSYYAYVAIGDGANTDSAVWVALNGQPTGASKTFTVYVTVTNPTIYVRLGISTDGTSSTAAFDNISLQRVAGNHIIQPNSTSAPTLSAKYNILTNTATLSTQTVTTRAGGYTINLSGSGSVTLSGTATGTFSAGINTFTATAGSLTVTVTGTVTNADIRLTIDTIAQPAYQRVGASTDYDTAGFYPYLNFAGTQAMYTAATVDFSATAQMTVFHGVTKLSDAALGTVSELGNRGITQAGSFSVTAPSGATSNYQTTLEGTDQTGWASSPYAAPISNVYDISYDISAAARATEVIPRVNGAVAQTSGTGSANAGTGNFGNYTLYLAARNNASLYFTGRMYPFFIVGASKSAGVIAQVENFIKARMPVSF